MSEHMMLDIETLGRSPGCVVASIGAVIFDSEGIDGEFHRSIDTDSCVSAGLEVEEDTLEWWRTQRNYEEVIQGGDPLREVLMYLTRFAPQEPTVWANSPSFDCVILEEAYDAAFSSVEAPWNYWERRDLRTLLALPGAIDSRGGGDTHNALDDAREQARVVIDVYDAKGWDL